MLVIVLWMVTSSYATPLGTYPAMQPCLEIGVQIAKSLKAPPRAVMADVMCIPSFIMPGMPMRPPAAVKPGPSA